MESELVGGFFTEHSSVPFVFFFLSEYSSIVLFSALTAILFLGGYNMPHFNIDILMKFEFPHLNYLYSSILPYLNYTYNYLYQCYTIFTLKLISYIKSIYYTSDSYNNIYYYKNLIKFLDLNSVDNSEKFIYNIEKTFKNNAIKALLLNHPEYVIKPLDLNLYTIGQSEKNLSFFNGLIYSIEYINNNLLSISAIVLGLKTCLFCFFFV